MSGGKGPSCMVGFAHRSGEEGAVEREWGVGAEGGGR